MATEQKTPGELQEHMLWTYYGLRVGLAAIGFSLPVVVFLAGGLLHGEWLKPSISDYYYYKDGGLAFLTTRDLFVAGLFAAGICLYLYKGFSNKENVALNLAGGFAALVATFPTTKPDADGGIVSAIHGTAAVLFFLSIAYVSLFHSRDTLDLLPDPTRRPRYERSYRLTGIAMLASPVVAVALSFWLERLSPYKTMIFFVETFGVWAFSAYWTVKTFEMRESSAEKRSLDGELTREVVPQAGAARPVERIVPA
jgi:hypothetical protein